MQMMSWMISRLGSRFSLFFEPHQRRVMHSALGRFLDEPLDLAVGLIEPDGTERVLPFCKEGTLLAYTEQFERLNSITFKGYSEHYRLRFEFNVHSVFYPQEEGLCTIPSFYVEMRVHPVERVQWHEPKGPTPEKVKLFLRIKRPETEIYPKEGAKDNAHGPGLEMYYQNTLKPGLDRVGRPEGVTAAKPIEKTAEVFERIVSLNTDAQVEESGQGLTLDLPVSGVGSGVKWRLVWGAYTDSAMLAVTQDKEVRTGKLKYTTRWGGLDDVVSESIKMRDEHLAASRRLEKLADQAPLRNAERHLMHMSFQGFLSNTFWCTLSDATDPMAGTDWFSVWDGTRLLHSPVNAEYNNSLWYMSFWPQLLEVQMAQWVRNFVDHAPSQGAYPAHDLGEGLRLTGRALSHDMPVEDAANFALLLQAHTRWSGDATLAHRYVKQIEKLGNFLLWADRERCGFATEGVVNAITDAGPELHYARKGVYLAIKRALGLQACGDLMEQAVKKDPSAKFRKEALFAAARIEGEGWLGDHFAVATDPNDSALSHPRTGSVYSSEQLDGCDAYSIHTSNAALLPLMTGQTTLINPERLKTDVLAGVRETLGPYGCSHTSAQPDKVWISQNLWRDIIARYFNTVALPWTPNYWELQVVANTGALSQGASDTYFGNCQVFSPRLVDGIGLLCGYPRLVIDRLAKNGPSIKVNPDTHYPQRWPLFALADWKAGKIPVCVVTGEGRVVIEGEIDPVVIGDGKK
jgi:xylan 1,4-beta-xylosidase